MTDATEMGMFQGLAADNLTAGELQERMKDAFGNLSHMVMNGQHADVTRLRRKMDAVMDAVIIWNGLLAKAPRSPERVDSRLLLDQFEAAIFDAMDRTGNSTESKGSVQGFSLVLGYAAARNRW